MVLPISDPLPPMEAKAAQELPHGPEWQYEPKWDGFRCIATRDGDHVQLQSKNMQPLARYFPELVAELRALRPRRFALDGEIVLPERQLLSFDLLLQRIHPAESRIRTLAQRHPALLICFDMLVDTRGRSLLEQPLAERRRRLEEFFASGQAASPLLRLSPCTGDFQQARRWFRELGGGADGIVAKRRDTAYLAGERVAAMQKIKRLRTADCVVGGFRYGVDGKGVGSLLLGLHDEQGLLHHVGFTATLRLAERDEVTRLLEELVEPPGFTGRAPGGPSRWNRGRAEQAWKPLAPKLVVEVQYDHFSDGRFRHGTKLLRWRRDKAPQQCTFAQVEQEARAVLDLL